jgi:hypothetical protein
LKAWRADKIDLPTSLCSGDGSMSLAGTAIQSGAVDCLAPPLRREVLLSAVARAIPKPKAETPAPILPITTLHSTDRWARVVVAAVASPTDPKTMTLWGRQAGCAAGSIKSYCYLAGFKSLQSLQFARLLRAVDRQIRFGSHPRESLDIADRRTFVSLIEHGGGRAPALDVLPPTIDLFLDRQRLISRPDALGKVRELLLVR